MVHFHTNPLLRSFFHRCSFAVLGEFQELNALQYDSSSGINRAPAHRFLYDVEVNDPFRIYREVSESPVHSGSPLSFRAGSQEQ